MLTNVLKWDSGYTDWKAIEPEMIPIFHASVTSK